MTGHEVVEPARDGAIRHAERIEGLMVLRQNLDALVDPSGGEFRKAQQVIGALTPGSRESRGLAPLRRDPLAIPVDDRPERRLDGSTIGEGPERLHGDLGLGKSPPESGTSRSRDPVSASDTTTVDRRGWRCQTGSALPSLVAISAGA